MVGAGLAQWFLGFWDLQLGFGGVLFLLLFGRAAEPRRCSFVALTQVAVWGGKYGAQTLSLSDSSVSMFILLASFPLTVPGRQRVLRRQLSAYLLAWGGGVAHCSGVLAWIGGARKGALHIWLDFSLLGLLGRVGEFRDPRCRGKALASLSAGSVCLAASLGRLSV